MVPYLGDFAEDETVYLAFNTFSSDDPAASVTITNLVAADIKVHKDGSTTEIVTDGATVAIDFDGVTGNHLITIDTSVDAAYATGSDYLVRIEGTTVDAGTINAFVGTFSIENRYMRGTDSAALASALTTAQNDLDIITGTTGVLLEDGSITAAKIATDAITTAKIADNAITNTELAAGAISSTTFATGAITETVIATNAIGAAELATDAVTEIQSGLATAAALSTVDANVDLLVTGVPTQKYAGPRGPGVYVGGTSINLNTVTGTDGTFDNPVTSLTSARTIADAIGCQTYYIVSNTTLTLAATHEDWTFMGMGELESCILNLGSQDVDRSMFYDLTIEGTQGGTARIDATRCALQDPGAGSTTLHIFAKNCGIVDDISFDTSNDNVLDACYSLVPGTSAPIARATGAAGTISIRHWSGGIQFEDLSASHNVSLEGHGNCIFAVSNNVNATVAIRGIFTLTDSTAGMSALSVDGRLDLPGINAQCDTALTDYDPPTRTEATSDKDEILAVLPASLVGGRIDANVGAISGDAVAADNLEADYDGTGFAKTTSSITALATGTAQAGGAQTITFDAGDTVATTDFYADTQITLVGGTGAGQSNTIRSYNFSTKVATVDYPWKVNPTAGTDYVVGPGVVKADVVAISGDSTAANNLELDYDGTGYAKANSTIGTTTTNTDMLTAAAVNAEVDTALADYDGLTRTEATADKDEIIAAVPTTTEILAAGDVDSYSLEEALKLILAAASGKTSGSPTTSFLIRAADDSKVRITATVDSDGNRDAVTLDATG